MAFHLTASEARTMSALTPEYLLNLTFRVLLVQHCGKTEDSSYFRSQQGVLTLGREDSLMVLSPWTRASLVVLFWHGAGRDPPLGYGLGSWP